MILWKNGKLEYIKESVRIAQWRLGLEIDGAIIHVPAGDVVAEMRDRGWTLRCPLRNGQIEWIVVLSEDESSLTVESTLANHGPEPVKLGKAYLLDSESVVYGQPADDVVALPWQVWGRLIVYPLSDDDMPGLAKVKVQFYNRSRKEALQAAFTTFQRADTEILLERHQGALTGLKAYCNFSGWELQPGKKTDTETFRLAVGSDPLEQLRGWADIVARNTAANVWQDTPIGYLGGAWVDTINGEQGYETITYENLEAINNRLGGLGIRYLWTSIRNIEGGLPGNWLKWNHRLIPSGREPFIQNVQDRGFIPGFWVGPFYLCSMLTDLMEELSDAILKQPDGTPLIVCNEWRHGDAGRIPRKDRPCLYALDPSHPKVLEFIRKVFETYHEWGVRYYMVDFLEAGAGNIHRFPYKEHYDKSLVAGAEAYTNFLRVMKKAAGKDAYLLSSTGPSLHHAGILDGVRTGNDFGEGRPLSQEAFFYPATYVINNLSFWTGAEYALGNQAATFHTHRKLYLNDSGNVLTVDKPLPLSHARIHATIHAFSGGPSMLGDDIRQISDERLSLLRKTLPRSKDIGIPIDLFDSPRQVGPRLFHRRVDAKWGTYDVVAAYNLASEPPDIDLDLTRLGLDADKSYLVWDFWNEHFMGNASGRTTIHAAPESVTVLRFVEDPSQPVLVGTDMHVFMGEMEILDSKYDASEQTLAFTATRPPKEMGTVFVHAPNDVYVKNFEGLHIAKDARDNTLIIAAPLKFEKEHVVRREIKFGKLSEVLDMSKLDLA